jgi:hypothetical protein
MTLLPQLLSAARRVLLRRQAEKGGELSVERLLGRDSGAGPLDASWVHIRHRDWSRRLFDRILDYHRRAHAARAWHRYLFVSPCLISGAIPSDFEADAV